MQKHSIPLKDSVLLLSALCFSHRLNAFHSLDGSNNFIVNNVLKTAFTCCQCGWIGLDWMHDSFIQTQSHVGILQRLKCISMWNTHVNVCASHSLAHRRCTYRLLMVAGCQGVPHNTCTHLSSNHHKNGSYFTHKRMKRKKIIGVSSSIDFSVLSILFADWNDCYFSWKMMNSIANYLHIPFRCSI